MTNMHVYKHAKCSVVTVRVGKLCHVLNVVYMTYREASRFGDFAEI